MEARLHLPMDLISKREILEEALVELMLSVVEIRRVIKVEVILVGAVEKPRSKCVWIIPSHYVR